MSSKSTQQTKKVKKKTPSGTQTRKSRPLSPGAATFEALNNPAYDTSERHFSPPMPISKPLSRSKSLDQLPRGATMDEDDAPSPHIFPPPFPAKEEDEDEDELGGFTIEEYERQKPLHIPVPQRPKGTLSVEDLENFDDFASVSAPDEPLKNGGGYMYPALKNYMKRSKRKSNIKSKKKSKKKSKRKSKRKSRKNSKKKSKKARRRV